MKIAIDYSLVTGEQAGIGQYLRNLVQALLKIDRENSYTLYALWSLTHYLLHPSMKVDFPKEGNYKAVYKNLPVPFQVFRYLSLVPGAPASFREYMLGGLDADVVHSCTFCVPRFRDRRKKLVVTIYDLTVITNPECHKKANIRHCTAGAKDAIKYADSIIAISEHTKRDLIERLGAPPELITVTQLAAGEDYYEVTDADKRRRARERYKLPENYILFVGSLEPRKNVKTLFKAYSQMKESYKKEFPLVIAGGRGWLNSDVPEMVKALGIEERVKFAGYIENADIAAVYSQAAAFAYPSLYEGFGLPILEAMQCGAPVITSNTSSMPEVAGDAAVLVVPTDAEELAAALESVLADEAKRVEMRRKGLERASRFSWERCARESLEVYKKVVKNG